MKGRTGQYFNKLFVMRNLILFKQTKTINTAPEIYASAKVAFLNTRLRQLTERICNHLITLVNIVSHELGEIFTIQM